MILKTLLQIQHVVQHKSLQSKANTASILKPQQTLLSDLKTVNGATGVTRSDEWFLVLQYFCQKYSRAQPRALRQGEV